MKMDFSGYTLRRLAACLLSLLLLSSGLAQQQQLATPVSAPVLTADEQTLGASVRGETIREVVSALSAADMQGRGTMQPGGDKAANYIADRFAKLGLKPLGDKNTYLQSIKFRETQFLPETSFKVGEENFKLGPDYILSPVPT